MVYPSKSSLSTLLLCLTATFAVGTTPVHAQTPNIDFDGPVTPGNTVHVKGVAGDTVTVLRVDAAAKDCDGSTSAPVPLPVVGGGTSTPIQSSDGKLSIELVPPATAGQTAISAGQLLCLQSTDSSGGNYFLPKPALVGSALPILSFTGSLDPASTLVTVQTNTRAAVWVFSLPADYKLATTTTPALCSVTDIGKATKLKIGARGADSQTIAAGAPVTFQLTANIPADTQLCLQAKTIPSGDLFYSSLQAVAVGKSESVKPAFAGQLLGGSKNVLITGQQPKSGAKTPTIAIYQFPEEYLLKGKRETQCSVEDIVSLKGKPLAATLSGSSGTQNYVTLSDSTPPPYNVTLVSGLVAGSRLCLVQTDTSTAGSAPLFSDFGDVSDPGDNGRARFDFTAGSVITNQQSSAKSSTAATYLDFGFYFTLMRAGGSTLLPKADGTSPKKNYTAWKPGIEDFIDLRMTSVPVATKTTTTTLTTPTDGSNPTGATSTDPNVLTSQQAATVFGGFDFPFRITRWDDNSNAFYLAPVIRSGFATLLNPSVDSSATSTTSTTGTTTASTTAKFDSVYWYDSAGLRIGWAKYPQNTNKAPIPIAQLDLLVGKYSNLPSIICDPKKVSSTTTPTQPTNTLCFTKSTTTTSGTSTTTYALDASRTLIPRLQLAGFIKFPGYPFLLGVDANLAQYAFGQHIGKVDTLNKPGNDVRIYFGVNLDPVSAIKKLGIPTP